MNKLSEQKGYQFPMAQDSEDAAILETAMQYCSQKRLKFKRGQYFVEDIEIPLGTQYLAQTLGWLIEWVKFDEGRMVESKIYRVARNERVPPRDELGDNDRALWKPNNFSAGQAADPWTLRHQLPLENVESSELHVFVTQSFWGGRAVSDLCANRARKHAKNPNCGMPIIRLAKGTQPSKKVGEVIRPVFEIVGWDNLRGEIREFKTETVKDELDDDIPF